MAFERADDGGHRVGGERRLPGGVVAVDGVDQGEGGDLVQVVEGFTAPAYRAASDRASGRPASMLRARSAARSGWAAGRSARRRSRSVAVLVTVHGAVAVVVMAVSVLR